MDRFTKPNLTMLRAEIDAALKAVGEKHGIIIHAGNASFTPEKATFKLELAAVDTPDDVGKIDWNRYALLDGFAPEDFGKTFKGARGDTMKICGYAPRSHKYPVLAKSATDGKIYKHQIASVMRQVRPEGQRTMTGARF